jgi:hypothetical protein
MQQVIPHSLDRALGRNVPLRTSLIGHKIRLLIVRTLELPTTHTARLAHTRNPVYIGLRCVPTLVHLFISSELMRRHLTIRTKGTLRRNILVVVAAPVTVVQLVLPLWSTGAFELLACGKPVLSLCQCLFSADAWFAGRSGLDIPSLSIPRTTFLLRDLSVIAGVGRKVIAVTKLGTGEVLGGSAVNTGHLAEIIAPGVAGLGLVCVETLLLLGSHLEELVVGRHFV